MASVPFTIVVAAPPASADCTNAGAATVCAQGTVRGGGPTAPVAGPAYPSYCADPWYCDDGWDMDVIIGARPPGRPRRRRRYRSSLSIPPCPLNHLIKEPPCSSVA